MSSVILLAKPSFNSPRSQSPKQDEAFEEQPEKGDFRRLYKDYIKGSFCRKCTYRTLICLFKYISRNDWHR